MGLSAHERDGGHVDSHPLDALHPRAPASPEAINRGEDAGSLERGDALEGAHIRSPTSRPHLGHDQQRTLPRDHIELEMPEPEVAREEIEPGSEEKICDRELGALAELGAGHVPPVFVAGPQFRPLTPPQVVQVEAPPLESNSVPLLMQ